MSTINTSGRLVTFGEVMMRLSPPGFRKINQSQQLNITYGGGEANVSMALSHLGLSAQHVSCFPDNAIGLAATNFIKGQGVSTTGTVFSGDRLGLYFLEIGAAARPSRVTYDRANSSFATLDPSSFNWPEILEGAGWFHYTGITPAISQAGAIACMQALQTARQMGIPTSGDINYRKNLWKYGKASYQVMPELVAETDYVISSKNDIKELLQTEPDVINDKFMPMAHLLKSTFSGIKLILNTKRSSITASHNTLSGMATNGLEDWETQKFEINPIIDRIGSGDAFAAGFIYGMLSGKSIQESLNFGVASGVLKHSVEGDFNIVSPADLELVASGDLTGKLIR